MKKKPKTGPKEGDMIPPEPGGDGKWRRVVLVMHGKIMGVEVWHGPPPVEPPKKARKKPPPAWEPKERNPFELTPVVQKFLEWKYREPLVRPKASSLTQRQKDRLLRLALVGKEHNWYGDWRACWRSLRETGATDDELMLVIHREFGASRVRRCMDKRRAYVTTYRRGKKGVFVIGEHEDPDRYVLEGESLLSAVRRVMGIKRNYKDVSRL